MKTHKSLPQRYNNQIVKVTRLVNGLRDTYAPTVCESCLAVLHSDMGDQSDPQNRILDVDLIDHTYARCGYASDPASAKWCDDRAQEESGIVDMEVAQCAIPITYTRVAGPYNGEYRVLAYSKTGHLIPAATYYTDDRRDAVSTAEVMRNTSPLRCANPACRCSLTRFDVTHYGTTCERCTNGRASRPGGNL